MTKSILIVDDMAFVRKALGDILRNAHYEVIGEAQNGEQAVAQYIQLRPFLVTLDVVMPEMSGIQAARQILQYDKKARILIISAMGQEQLVMEAIHMGARDYILKPFTADSVLKTIDKII